MYVGNSQRYLGLRNYSYLMIAQFAAHCSSIFFSSEVVAVRACCWILAAKGDCCFQLFCIGRKAATNAQLFPEFRLNWFFSVSRRRSGKV